MNTDALPVNLTPTAAGDAPEPVIPPAVAAPTALTDVTGTNQPDADLTEPDVAVWLRQVLDQVDATARAAVAGEWRPFERGAKWTVRAGIKPIVFSDRDTVQHILNHTPRQTITRVAAQRRIVNECSAALTGRRLYGGRHGLPGMLATVILAELASQYRDWPGYDPTWAPW